jgi:hypothetical protein
MTHVQCGICLDYHITGAHCHTCGAIAIGKNYYNVMSGRLMVRGIARPVHHLVDNVVSLTKTLPEPQLVKQ